MLHWFTLSHSAIAIYKLSIIAKNAKKCDVILVN